MKTTTIAALAAVLLAGPAAAGEPAPPAAVPPGAVGKAKPAEEKPDPKKPDPKKGAGAVAPKTQPKADAAAKKDAPCEPVKPCPIE